uniref:Uncharacterized protein n=1 Tax=Rhizophora mucronata TaxID=61149 RepID=A0A2P2PNQ1_RHIMU
MIISKGVAHHSNTATFFLPTIHAQIRKISGSHCLYDCI